MRRLSFILPYKQRNRRDYIIIRLPRGKLDPLIYRIEWVSASINALIFAFISQPFVSPQLKKLLKKD
ncbi:unnamed protein product [Adineta steineri]|uniref:Uncharacterized protein n=1 Tax=Adineta steineri TaxID=433720 RepID=A0A815XS66_9BILA|nr:unnamed protein product [Adineta steineri]CAF1664833.1 unnamed protein product [Adineta steineri]